MSAPANIPITRLPAGPLMWRMELWAFRTTITVGNAVTHGRVQVAALTESGALAAARAHVDHYNERARGGSRIELASTIPDCSSFIEVAAW